MKIKVYEIRTRVFEVPEGGHEEDKLMSDYLDEDNLASDCEIAEFFKEKGTLLSDTSEYAENPISYDVEGFYYEEKNDE
jgi:hypothetical protein